MPEFHPRGDVFGKPLAGNRSSRPAMPQHRVDVRGTRGLKTEVGPVAAVRVLLGPATIKSSFAAVTRADLVDPRQASADMPKTASTAAISAYVLF